MGANLNMDEIPRKGIEIVPNKIKSYQSQYTDILGTEVTMSVDYYSECGVLCLVEESPSEEITISSIMYLPLDEAMKLAKFIYDVYLKENNR